MALKNNNKIVVTGYVTEALPNAFFKVKLDGGFENVLKENKDVLAHLSGKMRMHYIKVLVGDKVKMDLSAYDTTKGRITQRF